MDGDDWDLAAVVRGCCSRAKAAGVDDPFSSSLFKTEGGEEIFPKYPPDIFNTSGRCEGLEDLYTPFLFKQQQQQQGYQTRSSPAAAMNSTAKKPQRAASQTPRSKRRKKQLKKVVRQVPADGVSSDMWAWRKYGQKPIKGSPYPRGYYRCSSFRGCPARKQVERNRTDPGQLIITYTAEHNHPMPARHKLPSTATSAADPASVAEGRIDNNRESNDQLVSSPTTSASVDGDEEEKEEEQGMLMVEDMEVIGEDDLVFVGDVSTGGASLFEDDRLFSSPPWLESSNNSSATAAAC